MSKNDKSKNNKAPEPWEQSIYETEYENSASRSQQRKKKRGNTVFLTLLVIMLVLIVAIPTVGMIMFLSDNGKSDKAASSSVSSTTMVSSTSSTTVASSSITEESSAEQPVEVEDGQDGELEDQNPENTDNGETDTAADEVEYGTVNSGEGPYTFANRFGISLDTLYALNGLNENSVIQPGQSLRVK